LFIDQERLESEKEGCSWILSVLSLVVVKKGKPSRIIASKIRRLITPTVFGRRKALSRKKVQQRNRSCEEAAAYNKLMTKLAKEV
ncbi:hypothetical protein OSTOST_25242, partial [Ostertagia ostertagi]